jgi:16S rRNA (cytosine1402-N4)-methyltransferase
MEGRCCRFIVCRDNHTMPNDTTPDPGHEPVLVEQVLALLGPRGGEVMLDCTVGRGGHAAAIVAGLAPGGRYIGLDVDPDNVAFARERLADAAVRVDIVRANFAEARGVLDELGVAGGVDLLLADLGFASTQMDDPSRGFSFSTEGPLDMRLDPDLPASAADLVNTLGQDELADLIYEYGEERRSRRVAQKIVEARQRAPIKTTAELARIVRAAHAPAGRGKGKGKSKGRPTRWRIDPATRTFMALRIAVNHELEALDSLLTQLPGLVGPGGRAVVISFHSLEDRRVKQAFLRMQQDGLAERLTRKPAVAGAEEAARNPRSRSAKLRAVRMAT